MKNKNQKNISIMQNIYNLRYLDEGNFFLIAGPCVVESRKSVFYIAETIIEISEKLKIPLIFKASYRKANRSKIDSFNGIGDEKALEILAEVKKKYSIPVISDIHTPNEAELAAQYVDVLQIPAFLCRQTDLLIAAAKTGKTVNIKKGQFLSPESIKFAAQKVTDTGNANVMLTDRGTMFGYNDLIIDFRGIPEMQAHGFPVVVDVTHSLQQPNTSFGVTSGRPEFIEIISRAAVAAGTDGIFIETHPHPNRAKSDGANMLQLGFLEDLLGKLIKIRKTINEF